MLKSYFAIFIYALVIIGMGYFLPRSAFVPQLALFIAGFLSYLILVYQVKKLNYSFIWIGALALGLRLLLLGAEPVLSDDFYRYFFDGHLVGKGINPYAALPEDWFKSGVLVSNGYWQLLLDKMNSPQYFSVYPPLHQLFFWMATWVGEDIFLNIISLRSIVLLFEMVNLWLIKEILSRLQIPAYKLAWYAFNPLVIIELTGNLHFEGMVLTGLLMALYFYGSKDEKKTALGWSMAVGIKLSPLLTAPIWANAWKKKNFIKFSLMTVILLLLFFAPLLASGQLMNFYASFRLYQSSFEFNASFYYLLRWFSGFFIDYNPIGTLGPSLNILAAISLLIIGFTNKEINTGGLARNIVWMYLVFLLLQTTVHPWYLIPALGVSLFTSNYIFVGWSGLVFLSYHAYADASYKENYLIVALEYLLLLAFFLYQIKSLRKKKIPLLNRFE
ncbi:carotene biosynthesis protein [Cyclobacterium sp. 1_MG-2023]|uniref:carotene biosynthesis protein n=1 Tax=Cyclobacterium sp. 1_MG-2023 TaxID=3062681 RepID=UPI0026E45912|nr:carotene biosynthesis protein [Cyclobacterium sp. 1_MG-2023]MDO6439194.1 carotene biosynthesis protein [Cyclobacterium sp. 1_MG-2023]